MNWKKYYESSVNSNDWLHVALLWFASMNVSLNPTTSTFASAMLIVWACTYLVALLFRVKAAVKKAKSNEAYYEKYDESTKNMGELMSKLQKQDLAKAEADTDALVKRQAEETFKLLLPFLN